MGPRLNSRGDADYIAPEHTPEGASLQWGRDLIVAETCIYLMIEESYFKLQWGRDLIVAETLGQLGNFFGSVGLQWGRDLIVAETKIHYRCLEKTKGFNGAAT